MWKKLSAGQKAPFEKKYQAESEKYQKKLAKSKFKKDENAPTRPQSAFFLFMGDERDDLVADGLTHKEAVSKLGEMWSALSAGKKKPYEEKAAALKAKYDKNLEKYKKTNAYKKYQAEKEEFMANRKAELKKLQDKQNPSRSRSKSKKPRAPKSR